jgi:hypothetical protein
MFYEQKGGHKRSGKIDSRVLQQGSARLGQCFSILSKNFFLKFICKKKVKNLHLGAEVVDLPDVLRAGQVDTHGGTAKIIFKKSKKKVKIKKMQKNQKCYKCCKKGKKPHRERPKMM